MNQQTLFRSFHFAGLLLIASLNSPHFSWGASLTYYYTGEITQVYTNENNAIPNLAIGDFFQGHVTFESSGWNNTEGIIYASLNGTDLLFTGRSIYGSVNSTPGYYAIRIAGDTGGSIVGSSFTAGNFGPELEDRNGSAGHSNLFPLELDLEEFETNIFRISGQIIESNDRISATGMLTRFTQTPIQIPEPITLTMAVCIIGYASCCRRLCQSETV